MATSWTPSSRTIAETSCSRGTGAVAGMTTRRFQAVSLLVVLHSSLTLAAVPVDDDGKLSFSSDFRFRLEQDFDSRRAGGSERADRLRARVRARLGLTYKASDALSFGLRLRSGSDGSQQSPHVTMVDFDDNDTGDADFNFDKWYLKAKRGNAWAWVGRNSLPIWKPNEMFWDDDVTPIGVGFGWSDEVGEKSRLSLNGGFFSLPVGMKKFAGEMYLGHLALATRTAAGVGLTLAGGGFFISANEHDVDAAGLRRGNGTRDYSIWVANFQAKLPDVGGRPLALGVDYMTNTETYSATDPDPFTAANRDQTDGYDAHLSWGGTSNRGDWRLGVWWAHIETFAVNASYAQDDWVRWGSATQTDSSDLEGFELRAARKLGGGQAIVARLYLVEAITSGQDGSRFRIDYNFKF